MMKSYKKLTTEKQDLISGYLFISPFIIGFLMFIIVPMTISLYIAFHKYDMLTPAQFIGWDNFKQILFTDDKFRTSLAVTLKYVAMAVPLRLTVALAVAMLINRPSRLSGLYRVLF